jgi:hypothetical protein
LHGAEAHAADDEIVGEPEGAARNAVSHVHISISNVVVAVPILARPDTNRNVAVGLP